MHSFLVLENPFGDGVLEKFGDGVPLIVTGKSLHWDNQAQAVALYAASA